VPSASASGTSSEDQSKGTLREFPIHDATRALLMNLCPVLEVYAIEIQMYSELRETKKLKASYLVGLGANDHLE
jgi:hypothetical protein